MKHKLKYDVNFFRTYYMYVVDNVIVNVKLRHVRVTTVAVEKQ